MTALSYEEVAAAILAEVRAIYSNGRKPDPDITNAWARVISRAHLQLPATLWREAVTLWSVSHSDPPSPHDVIDAAKQVVGQWESDPVKKDQLEEFRCRKLDAKFGDRHGAMEDLESKRRDQGGITSGDYRLALENVKSGVARRMSDRRRQEMKDAGSSELFANMNKQPGESWQEGA